MIVVGVILAGGKSRRMGGGDKFLRAIGGKSMLDHALTRLAPQVDQMILSVNGNRQNLDGYGLPIIEDGPYTGRGPLAGILAALRWSEAASADSAIVVSVPADTPFVPLDLAARLSGALSPSIDVAIATSLGQNHHAIATWPVRIRRLLDDWLKQSESFAVKDFLRSCRTTTVDFAGAPSDPFFNVNTPRDLEEANAMHGAP